MTVPVQTTESEKVSMTSPVTAEGKDGKYEVSQLLLQGSFLSHDAFRSLPASAGHLWDAQQVHQGNPAQAKRP